MTDSIPMRAIGHGTESATCRHGAVKKPPAPRGDHRVVPWSDAEARRAGQAPNAAPVVRCHRPRPRHGERGFGWSGIAHRPRCALAERHTIIVGRD